MAAGGLSFNKGSDMIHDYSCSKCEENDLNAEAQHFCPQCEHYLCDKCVKIHGGYFKKHVVYGRGDIQKWAGFSIDICAEHGKERDVVCGDHYLFCCSVCVALNHRLCNSISHLPDLARGFLKTAEFKHLPATVDSMRNRLDELKNNRMKYQASLKDSYKNIIAEIKALRKEINQILDKVEKETVEQLDSMMKDLEKSIKADLEACAHIYDELDTMIEKLQQFTGKNKETNSFIGFGKCHSKLNEANCLVKEIRGKERVEFKSDESVLQLLGNLSRLGNVAHDLFIHVNKAQSSRHYQVRIKNDKKTCLIDGICELPSGEVVLADRSNKRVKLLNKQFEVIDHSDMPGNPQHLCHITGNEVAVVVCDCISNEVHFLTVTKEKLQSMRKFTTDHNCVFIAHHQGQLYVGSMDGLYLYTMAGRLLKKIYEDLSGLLEVYSCAVSPSGERIYVSNYYSSKLITLCTSGQVLSTVKDPTLQDPTGLCVSPSGHVFVCGHGSNTVVLVE